MTARPAPDGWRYAGFWIRFVAFIVDSLAASLIITPVAYAIYGHRDQTAEILAITAIEDPATRLGALIALLQPASVGELFLNVVLPAVGVVAFWMFKSATPGKMATSTKLADATTFGAPSRTQCVVRYLGYFVSILGFFVGFLWIVWDERKQGWHDKIAGTVVLQSVEEPQLRNAD